MVNLSLCCGLTLDRVVTGNISGYECNHGSLSRERDTASSRGCYGEHLVVTRV